MPRPAPRRMKNRWTGFEASAGLVVGGRNRLILKEAAHSLETGAAGGCFQDRRHEKR